MNNREIKQGDVFMVNLSFNGIDHEQKFSRPCIIIQNNILNETSDNTIIVPLTSQIKKPQPFHYMLYQNDYPFFHKNKSIVLTECIRCISKKRLERKIGSISDKDMQEILKCKEYVFINIS